MISLDDVIRAQENIESTIVRTPVVFSEPFSRRFDADVHLKLENLQTTGSFKLRGATNRIANLSERQRRDGIVTASSGNHAQGVALAASRLGIDAVVVMPESTPDTKRRATRQYGADVVMEGADYGEARERAHEIERQEGRVYIPTFDDWDVIAGQGTIGLEILEDVPSADVVIVPIGGGGLISGIAVAIKAKSPETRIVGVEASGASTVTQSLDKGVTYELDSVDTIADGIAINSLGERPLETIDSYVDEVVTVDDDAVREGIAAALFEGKTLVEGAGATPLVVLAEEKIDYDADDVVVPVLSGGNVDASLVQDVLSMVA